MVNKFFSLLFVVQSFVFVSSVAQTIPDYLPAGNLLGWWSFNGDLNNQSGVGQHGYGGRPVLSNDRNGLANRSYCFDGTYAVLPSLSFNTSGNWSLSFWMKLVEYNEWMVVLDANQNMNCDGAPQIWQRYDAVHLSNCLYGTNNTRLGSRTELLNNWHHFVIVNKSDSVTIYRNGAPYSYGSYTWPSTTIIDITLANHRNTISMGAFNMPSKVCFDEVGVWGRGLTACEVTMLYQEVKSSYITQQPVGQFKATGDVVQFSVGDNGTNTSYQWQTNTGIGYQNLSNAGQYQGAYSNTLWVSDLTGVNNNQHFRCIVSQNDICPDTSAEAILKIVPAGIAAFNTEDGFFAYPNPASDVLLVKVSELITGGRYVVSDLIGKVLLTGSIVAAETQIDISGMPGGVYLLRLERGKEWRVKKIIKE